MTKKEILDLLESHILEVMPELEDVEFSPDSSLEDLGLNSIDRSDVIISAMEDLGVQVALSEIAHLRAIEDLVEHFHALPSANSA